MTKADAQNRRFSFLLVSQATETPWVQAIQRVLSTLGEWRILPEREAVNAISRHRYDLVIIDAGAVRNAASLVSRLQAKQVDLRTVVFTSSPTWQRAREVLQAGATNYVRKSLDEKEIQAAIESTLRLSPSSSEQ